MVLSNLKKKESERASGGPDKRLREFRIQNSNRRIKKFTWMMDRESTVSCQKHGSCSFWLRMPSVVAAEVLPLLTGSHCSPSSSSQRALMLPCCLSLDEATMWGFACNLPLVPDSQFQQEGDFLYPILCCLPKDLLHSRNSVFSQQRQAFPNPTPVWPQPPQNDWFPLA